jgi:hypothetical protein
MTLDFYPAAFGETGRVRRMAWIRRPTIHDSVRARI